MNPQQIVDQIGNISNRTDIEELKAKMVGQIEELLNESQAREVILRDALEKVKEALGFIACDGMDDGDFYAEENIVAGTIAMANRARSALAELERAMNGGRDGSSHS